MLPIWIFSVHILWWKKWACAFTIDLLMQPTNIFHIHNNANATVYPSPPLFSSFRSKIEKYLFVLLTFLTGFYKAFNGIVVLLSRLRTDGDVKMRQKKFRKECKKYLENKNEIISWGFKWDIKLYFFWEKNIIWSTRWNDLHCIQGKLFQVPNWIELTGVQNCPNQRTTLLLKISFSQKTVCHQKTWSR